MNGSITITNLMAQEITKRTLARIANYYLTTVISLQSQTHLHPHFQSYIIQHLRIIVKSFFKESANYLEAFLEKTFLNLQLSIIADFCRKVKS